MDPSGPLYQERMHSRDLVVREVSLWLGLGVALSLGLWVLTGEPFSFPLVTAGMLLVMNLTDTLIRYRRIAYRLYADRLELTMGNGAEPEVVPLAGIIGFEPWRRQTARQLWRTYRVDYPEFCPSPPLFEGSGWWVVVFQGKAMRRALIFRPSPDLVGRVQDAMRGVGAKAAAAPAGAAARPPGPMARMVP